MALEQRALSTKSARLVAVCPHCKERIQSTEERKVGKGLIIVKINPCGHSDIKRVKDFDSIFENFESDIEVNGRKLKPYDFQIEGCKFIQEKSLRGAILDEMTLGKTVQACMLMQANKDECGPFLVVCKSSLKDQWWREISTWTDLNAQIVEKSTHPLIPVFDVFIVSVDMLSERKIRRTKNNRHKVRPGETRQPKWVKNCPAKTVIIDECQSIKNSDSKRTKALRDLVNFNNIQHIIPMSGTPVENHAGEIYVIGNLCRPDIFWNETQIAEKYFTFDQSGKPAGIKKHMVKEWKKLIDSFAIRRRRDDVLPNLPKIRRSFSFFKLSEAVEDSYMKTFGDFEKAYDKRNGISKGSKAYANATGNLLAYMQRMRHLTGISKVENILEKTCDHLDQIGKKIVLFVDHQDVGLLLLKNLQLQCAKRGLNPPLAYKGGMTDKDREEVLRKFREEDYLILIASTRALAEGHNLQFCEYAKICERQWNPKREEQAEMRFPRPGSVAQSIEIDYIMAQGTIDELMGNLAERKRARADSAVDGKITEVNETAYMKELMDILRKEGRSMWTARGSAGRLI